MFNVFFSVVLVERRSKLHLICYCLYALTLHSDVALVVDLIFCLLRDESVWRRGRGYGRKMVSDLPSRLCYREDSLSYEMFFFSTFLFPFSLYIRGKVGFESSRMVLFYRIKLDLTNRVGNKEEFQQNDYPRDGGVEE